MKKLLTIFSSISLIAVTSATAIACSNNNKKEEKQSKEMNKNQTSNSTSTNMNNTQDSNSSTTTNITSNPINSATSMSTQPREEAFWKNEPLILSELEYVSQYFKRKEHIKKTSELVLDNSEGIKWWMENSSTSEITNRDSLAETQNLILENSNSLMNSTR